MYIRVRCKLCDEDPVMRDGGWFEHLVRTHFKEGQNDIRELYRRYFFETEEEYGVHRS